MHTSKAHLIDVKQPPIGVGTVTGLALSTVSSGTCLVRVGDADVTVQVARDLTVAVGDVLMINRMGSAWWAVARMFVAPIPPPPPEAPPPPHDPGPPPKPTVVTGTLICPPVTTQSYRSGWRIDDPDVFQGRHSSSSYGRNTGCAFYGTKPRSIAGATVLGASIRVYRLPAGMYGLQTATLRIISQATRPAGAPTLGASTTGPSLAINAVNNAFGIPVSWAQAMVDGTHGGLAVHVDADNPYMQFAGKASWSPAFTMSIYWRRIY